MGLTRMGMDKCCAEWESAPLAELYEFKNGVNADRRAYGQGIPFINVLEPITHSHLRGHEISGRVTLSESAVSAYEVRNGDLVFNRTSEIGEEVALAAAYLGNERVVFGGFVIRARPSSSALDSRFAAYALRARAVRSQIVAMGQGAVRANVGQENLRRVELQFPQLPEQLAIAEALTDIDALIGSLEQLLTKKRQIKQGAMQQLLTGKRRLPGFEAPWQNRPLNSLANIQRGASPRPIDDPVWFDDSSAVGWVRISDVTQSRMYLQTTTQQLSEAGIRKSRFVRSGNLIMSICATVGRPIITALDTCIHDGFVVFDGLAIDQKFLYYALLSIEDEWSKHGQTGSQMNLNTGLINRTEIPVPDDQEEQAAIAQVLSDMDVDIAAAESRLAKARALKQAMAQALLTGRTRLVKNDA